MVEELELLRQIVKNTASNASLPMQVAAITGISTLCGAGITAYVTYKYNKNKDEISRAIELKKLNASIITNERLRWLQELRGKASSFYTNMDQQYGLIKRPIAPENREAYQAKLDDLSKEIMKQCHDIILLLNPTKEDQKCLREAANAALGYFLYCVQQKILGLNMFDDNKYSEIKTKFFDSMTAIGIETWGKIKKLE